MTEPVYIVAATRTPVAKVRSAFRYLRPDDLLAQTLCALPQLIPQLPLANIEDVIMGCAMPEAEQGMNVARISALLAGYPNTIPAMTINRFCSSGLQAVSLAADRIASKQAHCIVAGGIESMTYVPLGGYHYSANPQYFEKNENVGIAYGMGLTAELVAKKWQISRDDQDHFALKSHKNAIAAQNSGEFDSQITAIQTDYALYGPSNHKIETKTNTISQDEGPRRDTSIEVLSKLKTVFASKGTITAGNASQMSDGASALLLVSEAMLRQYDLKPLARFCGYSVAGVAPEYMGIGPVEAIPKVLKQTGLTLNQIDWIELNEAFAAQSLAVIKSLDCDPNKINPTGGAIALGHPLGATGAILSTKLIHSARKRKLRYGMVTMCIGTGMGAAGIFEIL